MREDRPGQHGASHERPDRPQRRLHALGHEEVHGDQQGRQLHRGRDAGEHALREFARAIGQIEDQEHREQDVDLPEVDVRLGGFHGQREGHRHHVDNQGVEPVGGEVPHAHHGVDHHRHQRDRRPDDLRADLRQPGDGGQEQYRERRVQPGQPDVGVRQPEQVPARPGDIGGLPVDIEVQQVSVVGLGQVVPTEGDRDPERRPADRASRLSGHASAGGRRRSAPPNGTPAGSSHDWRSRPGPC